VGGRAIAAKVTAALGAVFLVGAFALATLLRPFFSLAELVMTMTDPLMLQRIDTSHRGPVAQWAWTTLALPLLLRPSWMLPVMLGVVFVGVAATLAWGKRR
jgi:hypothetical protein